MMPQWHVHLAGRQKIAWALDEDLAWVRSSFENKCRWTSLPLAKIVHAAWPSAVLSLPAAALRGKKVICQADNPPAFYLATESFEEASRRVDLWIARTSEAEEQFRLLDLPVARVPYCVDRGVFRPLPRREEIRRSVGISPGSFVIGNFHRDSEGTNLRKPKLQKGPDVLLQIACALHERLPQTVVLLAGPRRHWLRGALQSAGIPVVFAGRECGAEDDYPGNILSRNRLNELYQALDICVISSRWEGGPYAVLEALASRCPVISSPVGTSLDVLPGDCIFNSVTRAVEILETASRSPFLRKLCDDAAANADVSHSPTAMAQGLGGIYAGLPAGRPGLVDSLRCAAHLLRHRIRRAPSHAAETAKLSAAADIPCNGDIRFFDGRDCWSRADLLHLAGRIADLRSGKN